jgi:spore coat protein U-like protein
MKTISKENFSKKIISKSTTALTCLLTVTVIYANLRDANAIPATTTGNFSITTNVGNSCSVSLSGTINFGSYNPSTSSRTTAILYANCTTGTTGRITISTALDSAYDEFKLVRTGGNSTVAADYLWATFGKTGYAVDALGAGNSSGYDNYIDHSGTGADTSVATIYAEIEAGQSGKAVGTFNRTLTLQVTY